MSLVSALAIYFVLWWLVLFAVLPLWVRDESDQDAEFTLGTDRGAPSRPHLLRKFALTTAASALLFAALYGLAVLFDFRLEDLAG